MNMKKVLIIGANGLAGRQIAAACGNHGVLWSGTYYNRPSDGLFPLNILKEYEVKNFILDQKPHHIFHSANLAGGVNFCEKHPESAEDFHLKATRFIGKAAREIGASLTFFSTDYIFDGIKEKSYIETDDPNPLNVYGRLKLKAEEWIQENVQRYFILRTTNVYGWDPETATPNFLMGLYRKAVKGEVCCVPSYLWGNPTLADDLAEAAFKLALTDACGVYHAVSHEYINRYQWAEKFFKIFKFDTALLKRVDKMPEDISAPRPLKSNLNNKKLVQQLGFAFKGVDDGLNVCLSKSRNTHS